jgi:hypothetical protein
MARFNLSHGRYSAPAESRYARYIKARTIDGADKTATNAEAETVPDKHGTYGSLLFHPKWRERRKQILERDRFQCIICFSTENLEVHHRQYHFIMATQQFKPPWDYNDKLMITLCSKCHQRGHAKYKVPTINI